VTPGGLINFSISVSCLFYYQRSSGFPRARLRVQSRILDA